MREIYIYIQTIYHAGIILLLDLEQGVLTAHTIKQNEYNILVEILRVRSTRINIDFQWMDELSM